MHVINWLYLHVDNNQVVVSTKSPRSDKQYVWEAVADSSSYVVREETDPEKLLRRGTQITLYLRVSVILFISLIEILSLSFDIPMLDAMLNYFLCRR